MLQLGEGVPHDEGRAVEMYTRAAEQGLAGAQSSLAICFQNGHGVEKGEARAVEWYIRAARQGEATRTSHLRTT